MEHFRQLSPGERRQAAITALERLSWRTLPRDGNIKRIYLSQCPVCDGDLEYLASLPEIEEIHLFETRVTGHGLQHLSGLKQLHTLSIGKCPVNDLSGLAGLSFLRNLELVHLWDESYRTCLTDEGTAALATLTSLEKLRLWNGAITDVTLWRLAELTQLRVLDLFGACSISDAGLAALANLRQLRELRLGVDLVEGEQGPLTDGGLWYLNGLTELVVLDLEGQPITDAGLVALRNLKQLSSLKLNGTRAQRHTTIS